MKTNYYRLTKKELSFIRSIEEPIISSVGRLSRPVVVVFLGERVLCVYTLRWFRSRVKRGTLNPGLFYEIHAML